MASAMKNDLSGAIAVHLPYLRRFARALTGSQSAGDDYAAATLETILADMSAMDGAPDPRVGLFLVFYAIWSSTGGPIAEPEEEGSLAEKAQERLRPLPPRARVALLLNVLEGFDHDEVAQIMSVGPDEAAGLIEAGWQAIGSQLAGRILIVEDEPVIAMDLKEIVDGLGHDVVGVCDTRDKAVEVALSEQPNLVLADIMLADGSSGIDAVNDILSAFSVPVIFITAYPERLLTCERPEPTFLITKPFSEAQVRVAIGQALFFDEVLDNT